jgi:hypothetical protein
MRDAQNYVTQEYEETFVLEPPDGIMKLRVPVKITIPVSSDGPNDLCWRCLTRGLRSIFPEPEA